LTFINTIRIPVMAGILMMLAFSGCKVGKGLSVGPEGSFLGIPVEIGSNETPGTPSENLRAGSVLSEKQPKAVETQVAVHDETPKPLQVTERDVNPVQQVRFAKPVEISAAEPFPQLQENTWVKNLKPQSGHWRWTNTKMEELLILPEPYRPNFEAFLAAETNALIRANAAIVSAQEKSASEALSAALLDSIHSAALPLNMRSAAIEAYASLDSTTGEDLLQIFDTYFEKTDSGKSNPGKPELVLELLNDLPDKVPLSSSYYAKPLEGRNEKIRLAVLKLWRDADPADRTLQLPDAVAGCVRDRVPAIRAAAVETLAKWKHPQAFASLESALRDPTANVRCAAIHGLGLLNTQESVQLLLPMRNNPSSPVRASTASALFEAGNFDALYRMADDEDAKVRCITAAALAKSENDHGEQIARKYLRDPSPDVQNAMLEAIFDWNAARAYPIYLEAMDSGLTRSRITAAKLLTRRWPEMAAYDFQPEVKTDKSREALKAIHALFQRDVLPSLEDNMEMEFVSVESHSDTTLRQVLSLLETYRDAQDRETCVQIESRLINLGKNLVPVFEEISAGGIPIPESLYVTVLPKVDPMFERLAKFRAKEAASRREAATRLQEDAKYKVLSPLVYSCLKMQLLQENDDIVQIRLWELVNRQMGMKAVEKNDVFREFAHQLAEHSFAQSSPELHRRACEYLKKNGTSADVGYLITELQSSTPSVIRAALQAIRVLGNADQTELVRPYLTHPQTLIVIDAAMTLHHWGVSIGTDTLQRLTHSGDRMTRLAIVQSIRDTNDPTLSFLLIQMLDEPGSIRSEALDTLPGLTGKNIAAPQELVGMPVEERVLRWKKCPVP
jgi:HEAT repeat protein